VNFAGQRAQRLARVEPDLISDRQLCVIAVAAASTSGALRLLACESCGVDRPSTKRITSLFVKGLELFGAPSQADPEPAPGEVSQRS
jgi:hypothetical protein